MTDDRARRTARRQAMERIAAGDIRLESEAQAAGAFAFWIGWPIDAADGTGLSMELRGIWREAWQTQHDLHRLLMGWRDGS